MDHWWDWPEDAVEQYFLLFTSAMSCNSYFSCGHCVPETRELVDFQSVISSSCPFTIVLFLPWLRTSWRGLCVTGLLAQAVATCQHTGPGSLSAGGLLLCPRILMLPEMNMNLVKCTWTWSIEHGYRGTKSSEKEDHVVVFTKVNRAHSQQSLFSSFRKVNY